MTDHLSQHIIEHYQGRALSAAELIAVDDHLAECEVCRAALRQFGRADEVGESLLAGLQAEAQQPLRHLSFDELNAYVGKTLGEVEREIVASHLQVCAPCGEEAEDLLAFKASFKAANKTSIEFQESGRADISVKATPGLFDRLKGLLWAPSFRSAFQAGAALVIVAIAIFFLLLPLRRQSADLRAQLNQLQVQNTELQKQSATLAELQAQLETLKQENETLLQLQPSLEMPANALALKDAGGTVTLDAEGSLQGLPSLSSGNQQLITNALRNGRVTIPATVSEVTMKAGVLMSGSSPGVSFTLQSPVGTFVQSSRPVFLWRELQGATSYVVTVYDASFRVVAKSEETSKTEWTPPNELERGVTFRWQVTANVNGKSVKSPLPPAPEARFKVIDLGKVEDLQRHKQTFTNSHLALGIVYAQAGLLDDAERELQVLVRANPQSKVARSLLQSVKARRR